MKKTVLALILTLAMLTGLLAMTSCGSPLDGDDAIAAMKFIDEQMSDVKGYDVVMTMETGGVEVEIDAKIDLSGETPKMYMSTEMMGMGMEATLVDGTMYMLVDMGGVIMKQKTNKQEDIDEMMGDLTAVNDAYEYESAEFVSRENGVYVIKATLSEFDAKELIGDVGDLVISGIQATVMYECNAEGRVSKTVIEYSYTVDGTTVDSTMTMEFKNFDIPVISAPSDADKYEESSD